MSTQEEIEYILSNGEHRMAELGKEIRACLDENGNNWDCDYIIERERKMQYQRGGVSAAEDIEKFLTTL
tara:strand:- start:1795 stop:2001 length:207 start_codon:yes stop_codon:yes gene_type:complete